MFLVGKNIANYELKHNTLDGNWDNNTLNEESSNDEENNLEKGDEDYAKALEKTHRDASKIYFEFISQLKAHKESTISQKSIENKRTQYQDKLRRF